MPSLFRGRRPAGRRTRCTSKSRPSSSVLQTCPCLASRYSRLPGCGVDLGEHLPADGLGRVGRRSDQHRDAGAVDDRRPRATRTPHPVAVTSEIREDALTGATVAVAAARQGRPNLPSDVCPFCVGGIESPEPYEVRAFVNRWPDLPRRPMRGGAVLAGPRRHVLVARHRRRRKGRRLVGRRAVPRSAGARRSRTSSSSRTGGRPSGPRSPIRTARSMRIDTVPPNPLAELRRAEAHGCPLCAEDPGARLVTQVGGWRAWVPWASMYPYGIVIAPVEHDPDLPSLSASCRRDLAAVLVDVLARLDGMWQRPVPYMLWFHQRPFDGARWHRPTCTSRSPCRSAGRECCVTWRPANWASGLSSTRSNPRPRPRRCGASRCAGEP